MFHSPEEMPAAAPPQDDDEAKDKDKDKDKDKSGVEAVNQELM